MEAVRRPRLLTEIDPHSEWVHGGEFDTLVVDVTGFGKEHLKVMVEPTGTLKVSGERAVDGRQWCHFTKRFDLPAGCDAADIKVQLDKGMLYVQVPRPTGDGGGAGQPPQHYPAAAETYEDALQGECESGGDGGGWDIGRVALRREEQHPVLKLARGLSRHRQVVLNVLLAVVLLWLVAFGAKND
ncbi:unnamed protein product [Urochloa humidicola]